MSGQAVPRLRPATWTSGRVSSASASAHPANPVTPVTRMRIDPYSLLQPVPRDKSDLNLLAEQFQVRMNHAPDKFVEPDFRLPAQHALRLGGVPDQEVNF